MKRIMCGLLSLFVIASTGIAQIELAPSGGPNGGTVNSLAIAPDGELLTIVGHDRLYYSDDNAEHWREIDNISQQIDNVRFDVGEILSSSHLIVSSSTHTASFVSSNGGREWVVIPFVFNQLKKNHQQQLFGITGGSRFMVSHDSGFTWQAPQIMENYIAYQIAVHPTTAMVCLSLDSVDQNNRCYDKLFCSLNGGSNWSQIPVPDSIRFGEVVIGYDNSIFCGNYRTTDFGISWQSIPPLQTRLWGTRTTFSDGYLYDVAASPENRTSGIARLPFGGNSWELLGEQNWFIVTPLVRNSTTGMIFAGTIKTGVIRFSTNYAVAEKNRGMQATNITNLQIDANDTLSISAREGIFTYNMTTLTWQRAAHINGYVKEWVKITPDIWLVSTDRPYTFGNENMTTFRTTDRGVHWDSVMYAAYGNDLVKIAPNGSIYILQYSYLFVSHDSGRTFQEQLHVTVNETFTCIAFPNSSDTTLPDVLLGTRDGLYRLKYDGRMVGERLLDNFDIKSIDFRSDGVALASTQYGVCQAATGWGNWGYYLNRVVGKCYIPEQDRSQFYLLQGDSCRILHTTLGAERFDTIYFQPLSYPITDYVVDIERGYIYFGTDDNGVYRNLHPLEAGNREPLALVPLAMTLHQNYPNPFNSSTTISYSLPIPSNVELSIFDIQGRVVEQLVRGNLPAGMHTTQWNAQRYPSGTYFYRLQTTNKATVQRMELLK